MLSHCESHTARQFPPTDWHPLETGYEVGERTLHHGDAQTYDNHRKQDMLYGDAFFLSLSLSLHLKTLVHLTACIASDSFASRQLNFKPARQLKVFPVDQAKNRA